MRIVAWNCNMALHRKLTVLVELRPDIAVIPECADPATLSEGAGLFMPASCAWVGENSKKGLGVFGFGDYRVTRHSDFDPGLRYVLPLSVSGHVNFNLLAVWSFNHRDGSTGPANRPGALLRALERYAAFAASGPLVVAGDFNNNVRWDRPGKQNNHAAAVEALERLGLISAYHHHRCCKQGSEPEPTLYWRDRRHDGLTYHIDYCFVPVRWRHRVIDVYVGPHEPWTRHSDHVPLVVDIADAEDGSVGSEASRV